jgi:hypothetical protein
MAGRWCVAATVCMVLAIGCGDSGTRDDPSETFESSVYGYSMRYPAGWSSIPAEHALEIGEPPTLSSRGTDVLAARAAPMVCEMQLPAIVVGAQPVEPGTTLDDWTAEVEQIVNGFKGCADPTEVDHLDVGGALAAMLAYPDCPARLALDHLWVAFVHDDLGFQIVWFDESSDGAVERGQREQILSTVSFPR